ncbi:hypothetical protein LHP98_00015 [Rhodobacter sp. Har01]|uniref:hypothetical protein n=1 Tax=Rhodobacter sp. Har01 TaxID=2883999 RepID=UPI001D091658|nr:hypothetical protein [Rhodobacter sp. Har01]MCB6176512.1 hypothetical protein [Rhodobacter sp. Har01]
MTPPHPELEHIAPARKDVPADRVCMRCKVTFRSEGFGERICPRCKSSVSWRTFVSVSDGRARRG